MRRHFFSFIVAAMLLFPSTAMLAQTNELPRSTPEEQGVASGKVIEFFDSITSLKTTEIHSVILMRHGRVIAEMYPCPFNAEYGHTMFSCSKAFTAVAVGIAIDENRLRLTDRLATFFPELLPDTIDSRLASITIRDLLTMTSGFLPTNDVRTQETEWTAKCLANAILATPGTRFAYDSMNTYLLSAIIQRVTGQTMLDYLRPRLFTPLHIEKVIWESSPEGVICGGWALYLQPESMAKFGQLLLNKGNWNGQQLISRMWVEEMMQPHVELQGGDSYCYQMWQCTHPYAVRADGAYGQYIIVMPQEDAVAVITQCATRNAGKRELDMLFHLLLPSFSEQPLPLGKDARHLSGKVYSLPFVVGKGATKRINSIANRSYRLPENHLGWKSFTISQHGKQLELTIETVDGKWNTLVCGHQKWISSNVATHFPPNPRGTTLNAYSGFTNPFIASSSYAWENDSALCIKTHFVDWMSGFDIVIRFDNLQPCMEVKLNYDNRTFNILF